MDPELESLCDVADWGDLLPDQQRRLADWARRLSNEVERLKNRAPAGYHPEWDCPPAMRGKR